MVTATPLSQVRATIRRNHLAMLASVRLTVALLCLLAVTILIGAWCPQESQVGFAKVVEEFGEEGAVLLRRLGITDIFHSPWLLLLVGLLSVNMVACSMQRVFPKIGGLRQPMPFLVGEAIGRLPISVSVSLDMGVNEAILQLEQSLKKLSYRLERKEASLVAEFGKVGRLAPTITHVGLLTLLAGVTITSWTGFSGFEPVALGGEFNFDTSEHSHLWLGKLPNWKVRVESTRREDYESGDPKQWYSNLAVIDESGRIVKRQEIKVNEPLSFQGVDIYQSSWALDSLVLSFNGHKRRLDLRQMGKVNAAFLPLDPGTILIFSVLDQQKPLRVFAKTNQWGSPRLIAEIPVGEARQFGGVTLKYEQLIPVTGLQYKCDPGLPIVYVAFALIMLGVVMATIPQRQVWASAVELPTVGNQGDEKDGLPGSYNHCVLHIGGSAKKAKVTFERQLMRLIEKVKCVRGELS